jgi:PIF1-like helicase
VTDLLDVAHTWEESFTKFMASAPKRMHDIVAGLQYYYDCSDSASRAHGRTDSTSRDEGVEVSYSHDNLEMDHDREEMEEHEIQLTEADIQRMVAAQTPWGEFEHGRRALEIAKSAKIFNVYGSNWSITSSAINNATGDDLRQLELWQQTLLQSSVEWKRSNVLLAQSDIGPNMGDVVTNFEDAGHGDIYGLGTVESLPHLRLNVEQLTSVDPSCLFEEQRRAFDIVNWHVAETLAECHPPQLFMHILGEGGVGKSKVIQTMTDNFSVRGIRSWLIKAAYTGIAASIIGGSTLHTVARLPLNRKPQSGETQKKLSALWSTVYYLIIDEISMVSRDLLAKLSRIISKAKAHGEISHDKPFGGVNVIIFGDLHQFPPVAGRNSAPLYWPINQAMDTEDEMSGTVIYEQFQTVVKLRKQVRITDPRWQELLHRARSGDCTEEDLKLLRSLILTNPECSHIDFSCEPWKDAVRVTPRHGVWIQWNKAAVEQHCSRTGEQRLLCHVEDTIRGRQLTL